MYKVIKEYQYVDLITVLGDVQTIEEANALIAKDYPHKVYYSRGWGNAEQGGEYRDLGSHQFLYKIIKF